MSPIRLSRASIRRIQISRQLVDPAHQRAPRAHGPVGLARVAGPAQQEEGRGQRGPARRSLVNAAPHAAPASRLRRAARSPTCRAPCPQPPQDGPSSASPSTASRPAATPSCPGTRCARTTATCVAAAGGLPIALPHEPDLAEHYLALIDGLVVTGGAFDVDPAPLRRRRAPRDGEAQGAAHPLRVGDHRRVPSSATCRCSASAAASSCSTSCWAAR